jgi:hypothetical protein
MGEFVTIDRLVYQDCENFEHREYAYLDEDVNLCPKCTRIFTLFMSGNPLVEKQLLDALQEDYDAELEEKENDDLENAAQAIRDTASAICNAINGVGDSLRRRIFGRNDRVCENEASQRKGDSEQESKH